MNETKRAPARRVMSERKPSDQEWQMIEIIRKNEGEAEFSLFLKRADGGWEIEMAAHRAKGRGVGSTFAEAWDNIVDVRF